MKYYGYFNPTAAKKALKQGTRLVCTKDEDGYAYVSNGCVLYKLNPMDYDEIVRPMVGRDAGNWSVDSNGYHDGNNCDVCKYFTDTVAAADTAAEILRCPLTFTTPGKKATPVAGYYRADTDTVIFFNTDFPAAVIGATIKAADAIHPAIAYVSGGPVAILMPMRIDDKGMSRAIQAYFADTAENAADTTAQNAAEIERLRRELAAAQERAAELTAELNTLRAAQEEKPDAKSVIETLTARLSDLPGLSIIVKGSQTAAPIIWINGETRKYTAALKEYGALWSAKKQAYYIRVA